MCLVNYAEERTQTDQASSMFKDLAFRLIFRSKQKHRIEMKGGVAIDKTKLAFGLFAL
jgi:hypothetical protein